MMKSCVVSFAGSRASSTKEQVCVIVCKKDFKAERWYSPCMRFVTRRHWNRDSCSLIPRRNFEWWNAISVEWTVHLFWLFDIGITVHEAGAIYEGNILAETAHVINRCSRRRKIDKWLQDWAKILSKIKKQLALSLSSLVEDSSPPLLGK